MNCEDVKVMKKSIIDAGLIVVEPDDLERLAEDTIDENEKKSINNIDTIMNK